MTATETTRITFDLTRRPWLPVTLLAPDADDKLTTDWSLRQILSHAHEAKGLNEPSPLTFTAIMRYLLAILNRALEGPADEGEWVALWDQGSFTPEQIDSYLDRWQHRFDLFDTERPFAQLVMMENDGAISPVTRLLPERASGNNAVLFDHSWDENPVALDAGAAARALLTGQAYAFSGTGGMFKNSALVAGYCLFLEGQSLFQTLMLNLRPYDPLGQIRQDDLLDQPWWESNQDPVIQPSGNRPLGLTDLLTWRARKVHLLPDSDRKVRQCRYHQWYALRPDSPMDPYKRYAPVQSGENAGNLVPQNFLEERALWRDSYGFFPKTYLDKKLDMVVQRPPVLDWPTEIDEWLRIHKGRRLDDNGNRLNQSLLACGLVNNQARISLWRMDRMPMPLVILEDESLARLVEQAVRRAEQAVGCLTKAARAYADSVIAHGDSDRKPNPDDARREAGNLHVRERFWSALDITFPKFVQSLTNPQETRSPAELFTNWEHGLQRTAAEMFFDATLATNSDANRMRARAVGITALNRELRITFGR